MPRVKKEVKEREVLYPEYDARLCVGPDALTIKQIQDLLGWTDDAELAKEKDAGEYLLTDLNGKKVWLLNNVRNRPIYMGLVETYMQEHLNRRWRFNGETIIIGKYGSVLNGQHQMIGAVLAEQKRVKDAGPEGAKHWLKLWPGPITMEKVVVFGVDETDEIINTMDTCKPRSFADVIYRSEYFKNMKSEPRRQISKMVDHAVRKLWERTGAGLDHWVTKRTHAEGIAFLDRHPRLLRAVKHIYEENNRKEDNKAIARYYTLGYASAMLYLMGACETDGDVYRSKDVPSEKQVDWHYWDKAAAFWTALAAQDPSVKAVVEALGYLNDPETGAGGSVAEKTAVLCKAWNAYKEHGKVDKDDVALEYHVDKETDIRTLAEAPTVGGIELVEPPEKGEPEPSEENPEVVEERKKEIRQENMRKLLEDRAKNGGGRKVKPDGTLKKGQEDNGEEPEPEDVQQEQEELEEA